MTQPPTATPRLALVGLAFALALGGGCSQEDAETDSGPYKPPPRVPTSGVVRLDGKPLAGALVTFLPVDSVGTLTNGETKEDGSYELYYVTYPGGTAPGSYRVAVSLLQTPEGETISSGMRNALVAPPELIRAKERLPKKYSELGQTVLAADVPAAGGTFNFDLEGPLLDFPTDSKTPAPSEESAKPSPLEEPAAKAQAGEPIQPNHVNGDSPAVEPKSKSEVPSERPPAGKAP